MFHSFCEGMDVANKEQLPLIIRFVDQSGMFREKFSEFVLCDTSTSGQAITDKFKFPLEKLTLDLNDFRGQGYDGAGNISGNMSGKQRGCRPSFNMINLRNYTSICVSHVQNLCVVVACSIQAIRNMELWRKSASSLLPKMATRATRAY